MTETTKGVSEIQRGEVWLTRFGAGRPGEPSRNWPAVIGSMQAVTADGPGGMVVLAPVFTALTAILGRDA